MAVDSKHPLYLEHILDWEQMRDTYAGERKVKERGFRYLPPTSGMVEDGVIDQVGGLGHRRDVTRSTLHHVGDFDHVHLGNKGTVMYRAYRTRAWYPDWVREAVKALLGTMHSKPPTIELPSAMEFMLERATARNESLEMLLQRINEEQLVVGRVGILADVIDQGERTGDPYLALYLGEDIINWDEGGRTGIEVQNLNLVVLNESTFQRSVGDFDWDFKRKFRFLILGDVKENEPEGEGIYQVGVFEGDDTFNESALITPQIRGNTLDQIPFAFVNAQDVVAEPDRAPLLGLSSICLLIYRGEADYRQALFMQGQDTLVVIGGSKEEGDEIRVGASARIDLTIGGDAKYIGVDSAGLSEQREAQQNDNQRALQMSGQLIDTVSREKESGEALNIRVAARTSTLNRVALSGAFALQDVLRKVAVWMGEDPNKVLVDPNLDFVDDKMTGQDLSQFMGAKMLGAPLAAETVHKIMTDRGVTELTFEEEVAKIQAERELELVQSNGTTDKDGPERDDDDEEEDEEEK